MGLQRYKEKRNFRATPEPEGKVAAGKRGALKFVIQKHDATRLHYDFRLELNGVLLSWAVPKGIPTKKADKRLAMHVEDHPLDYGSFEGIIPEGNYGAGSVMLWDTGTWEPVEGEPNSELKKGKLKFVLRGEKLNGEWTLVRMRARSESSGKDEWLLIKTDQDTKPISAKKDDESVTTHRTMAQIAGQKTRTWKSDRASASSSSKTPFKERVAAAARAAKAGGKTRDKAPAKAKVSGERPAGRTTSRKTRASRARGETADTESDTAESTQVRAPHSTKELLRDCPAEAPQFVEPMKARLVETVRRDEDWLLEVKHDGYRAIAVKNGSDVELFSRNHLKMTSKFPAIAAAVRRLPVKQCVLDGEIVALDESGHGAFQLLQNRERITDESSIVFYVFDLLNLEGRNVRDLRLSVRRELLQAVIANAGDPIRFSAAVNGSIEAVLAEVKRLGLEGIIAKKPGSKYEVGLRSGSWIKVKCVNEQEFVVGGFTEPKGSRDHFGALLVGYYEGDQLMFASKVGTGFTQETLRQLFKQFQPLRRPTCPFVNLPTKRSGRFGQGVTAAEMRLCTWLEPKLVAQIRFTEWTGDGGLRHPVFLGLREDKKAGEVGKERRTSNTEH